MFSLYPLSRQLDAEVAITTYVDLHCWSGVMLKKTKNSKQKTKHPLVTQMIHKIKRLGHYLPQITRIRLLSLISLAVSGSQLVLFPKLKQTPVKHTNTLLLLLCNNNNNYYYVIIMQSVPLVLLFAQQFTVFKI